MEKKAFRHLRNVTGPTAMKNSVSLIVPKAGPARWGNFNHTTLVQATLLREHTNDTVEAKLVEGMVRSALTLDPLAGISVILLGTNLETKTDSNGWFSLRVEKPSATDKLIVAAPGFNTAQVAVKDEDFVHVNLSLTQPANGTSKRWKLTKLFWFKKRGR